MVSLSFFWASLTNQFCHEFFCLTKTFGSHYSPDLPSLSFRPKIANSFLKNYQPREAIFFFFPYKGDGIDENACSNNEPLSGLDSDNIKETSDVFWMEG